MLKKIIDPLISTLIFNKIINDRMKMSGYIFTIAVLTVVDVRPFHISKAKK